MSSEQNKTIVRRAIEEPWKGNLDIVDELTASDYVGHDPASPEPLRGPEGVKEFISTYRAAFSDARITVEQQFAEGDLVATRWTARCTHEGELMGIQPTGKQVTVSGLTTSRLSNGKIVEEFTWDTFAAAVIKPSPNSMSRVTVGSSPSTHRPSGRRCSEPQRSS